MKHLIIKTIGDSLTEGSVRDAIIGTRIQVPNIYQYWLYAALTQNAIANEVWNLGIGGQTIDQICDRFQDVCPRMSLLPWVEPIMFGDMRILHPK